MKTTAHTTAQQKAAKFAGWIFNGALIAFGIWYIVKTFVIAGPQIF